MATAQQTATHIPAPRGASTSPRPGAPRPSTARSSAPRPSAYGSAPDSPPRPSLRLPRGGRLSDEAFALRARVVRLVLGVHLAVSLVVGLFSSHLSTVGLLAWLGGAVVLGIVGLAAHSRTTQASATCLALLVCAAALVDASGGSTTMHFDFFVILAFCAIYQEWIPYLTSIAFVAAHHLLLGTMCTGMVFGEQDLAHSPVVWSLVHATFILAGCVAGVILWALNEAAQAESDEARARAERLAADQEEMRQEAERLERARTEDALREAETAERRAEDLRRSADALAATATASRARSIELTQAAADLADSVVAVASSTGEASEVGRVARGDAERVRAEFAALADASVRIRTVVRSVARIASQTQMLALNAQIEAGRAGAAGRGFVVVAEEVKQLSEETRRATEDIDASVRVLVSTSEAAGVSLTTIEQVLQQIEALQSSIASAAEQQRGTSSAISSAAAEVSRAVSEVSEAVHSMAAAG